VYGLTTTQLAAQHHYSAIFDHLLVEAEDASLHLFTRFLHTLGCFKQIFC